MTSAILKKTFQKMDKAGITQGVVDEEGKPYRPAAIIDGHISRWAKIFCGTSIVKPHLAKTASGLNLLGIYRKWVDDINA
jgi:hypothetical protein